MVLCAAFAFAFPTALLADNQGRVELNAYGSIEPDEVAEWVKAFEDDNPGIKLNLIRGSTGDLTARILAERSAPKADVIWRLANTSLILFSAAGMLLPYEPMNYQELRKDFRSNEVIPTWVGHVGYMGVICANTRELERLDLPTPRSWNDLLDPRFRGRIVMPSPASSGTGLLHIASWLTIFGNDAGWKFVGQIDKNMAFYTTSGSKPCTLVGSGEFPIGLSFSTRAAELKASGAPIELIFPREGVGWDLEGSAILRGTKNADAAKRFLDWAISPRAMNLYAKRYPLVGLRGAQPMPNNHPTHPSDLVVPLDFYFISANRDRWIGYWEAEFGVRVAK